MNITLHQFAFSHFNEKARWALTFKNVQHTRKTYLPGPHIPSIKRLSGQSQTPVLQADDEIVAGSAPLIDWLEQHIPEPALYPADAALRKQALDWQTRLDEEFGPAVRAILFARLLAHGGYFARMFAGDKPWLVRTAYRATYPFAKPLIAKGNGADDPDNVARCADTVERMLDEVAAASSSGYLVGDTFSVADLTAAALIAPVAAVEHVDMARPQPIPDSAQSLIDGFATHPAIQWVQAIYRKHR